MRYLILAAGVGKRMGSALAGLPKCMIDIDGEPLIARLLRQIRQFDAAPETQGTLTAVETEVPLPHFRQIGLFAKGKVAAGANILEMRIPLIGSGNENVPGGHRSVHNDTHPVSLHG